MDLDILVEELERQRISLDDLSLRGIRVVNPTDPLEIKGKIAEKLVEQWLSRHSSIDMNLPLPTDSTYRLERTNS